MGLDSIVIHVIADRAHAHSFQWIQVHQVLDEVPTFWVHILGIIDFAFLDLCETFEVVFAFPRELSHLQHIEDEAEAPKIRERTTLTLFYHFWC